MTTEDEYAAFVEPVSEDAMAVLHRLADKMADAEREVEKREADLAAAQKLLKDIREKLIPEAMDEIGIEDFRTTTGLTIEVKEEIRASISKEKHVLALQWLRDNGYGNLIKRVVTVPFGKGEDTKAIDFVGACREAGLDPEDKETVHAQTLSAFVREKLETGAALDMELLGVFRQRFACLSMKKRKKK